MYIILICIGTQILISRQEGDIYSRCVLRIVDFHSIYSIYLRDVNEFVFNILQTDDPSHDLNYFADKVALGFTKIKRRQPIKWQKIYLETTFNISRPTVSLEISKSSSFQYRPRMFKNISRATNISSRGISHGYVYLVWDEKTLKKFLIEYSKKLLGKIRGIYFIMFVEDVANSQTTSILPTLPTFWQKFGVYNVIATTLCSSDKKRNIFVYDPFFYPYEPWGMVRQYTTEEILANPNIIFEFMDDFNGYPVRISMFSRPPTAIDKIPRPLKHSRIYNLLLKNSGGFGGVDGCIIAYLSSRLNFTSTISQPQDNLTFGLVQSDCITGSLGEVVRREVDISANGRFLMSYGLDDHIEYTLPVTNNLLCAIVPKSERIPQWRMIFHGFSADTWLFIFGVAFLCSCFWFGAETIHFTKKKIKKGRSFVKACLDIVAVILNAPIKLPRRLGQRIFIASLMGLNVIIGGIFQGTLVQSFSTISYYPDINTLKQLDKSGLSIATSLQVFRNDSSELIRRLSRKVIAINASALERAAYYRDVAAMERKQDADFLIRTKYLKDDMPLLHIVNECPSSLFITYIVPKDSPFLPKFNSIILNFFEAGLITKWYDDFLEGIILEQRFDTERDYGKRKPFSLSDIQTAFYILIFGYACSVVAFITEFILSK